MGARLYNPATGHFTSLDPVFGGNDTTYAYPNDPINKQDLSGEKGFWRKVGKWAWKNRAMIAGVVLTAAMFVPGLGVAAGAVRAASALGRVAGWAQRGASAGVRAAKAWNHSKKAKFASNIAGRFNKGRARVSVRTHRGITHYDLKGRAHGGILTPHKYMHHFGSRINGQQYMGRKGPVRPMGWVDILRARKKIR